MTEKTYLAIDIGASGGRLVPGHFDGRRLRLEEIHRFENGPVEADGHLYWDLLGLWSQVRQGLQAAAARTGGRIVSVGVDTWGVDFGLLDRNGELLGNPYHYRDSRTNGLVERACRIVPREEIFRHTGLQFMQINTLYQLLAMKLAGSPLLETAQTLLMMPDLFHWLLSGVKCNEMTEASTSQFYNPVAGDWAGELLDKLGLPRHILGRIEQPGTRLGPLRPSIAAQTGLQNAAVVLPGSHDTASAVLAVPADSRPGAKPDWCYISLGTWALIGLELPQPLINDKVLSLNFTNEGGVGRTTRLLKNISGLWLLQECRRVWNRAGRNWSWEDLNELALAAKPLQAFIDPDAPDFLAPQDMPQAIRDFCRRSGQSVPEDEGGVLRCALDSLAMKFRRTLELCEELLHYAAENDTFSGQRHAGQWPSHTAVPAAKQTHNNGSRIETIHIVGGGVRNRLLCQAAADACSRRVLCGPVEATATGNVMMQAIADGAIGSIAEAREIVRRGVELETYEPINAAAWDEAYPRFLRVCAE
jgi:rhamnulokinase